MSLLPQLHRRREQGIEWVIVGTTHSRSSTWYFDRWRLYYPEGMRIGIITIEDLDICAEVPNYITKDGKMIYTGSNPVKQDTLFHSGGGWTTSTYEHDFSLDLSNITTENPSLYIVVSMPPATSSFQQIYANPTGYGATRNSNALIAAWDFSNFSVAQNVGGADGSIIFSNQPIQAIDWLNENTTPKLLAKTIWFDGAKLEDVQINNLINYTDVGQVTNGSMKYQDCLYDYGGVAEGISRPTIASRSAYDSLIAKGWTITGTPPPLDTQVGTGLVMDWDAGDPLSYPGNVINRLDDTQSGQDLELTQFTYNNAGYFDITDASYAHRIVGGAAFPTNGTIVFWIKTTDIQALFLHSTATSGAYIGAFRVGNKGYHSISGITTYVDKVNVANNLYDNIRDGQWHMVEFKGVNISSWTDIHFNGYTSYTFGAGTQLGKISIYQTVLTTAESAKNYDAFKHIYS